MTEATAAARLPETPDAALDARQVAAFLQTHPDFLPRHVAAQLKDTLENLFAENPGLLTDLQLSAPSNGTISLPHVQLRLWRERLARLEHTIAQLHVTAENNAQLDQIMHDFARALLGAQQRTEQDLRAIIDEHFVIDTVRVLPLDTLQPEQIDALQGWLSSDTPLCGRLTDAQRRIVFDADFPETGSAALIALCPQPDNRLILALGRHAPDGFNPSQGTLFLKQIGQLAETFLSEPATP